MRFKCETFKEKESRLEKWTPWFAWYPVCDTDGNIFWLETVECCAVWITYVYEWRYYYREYK